MRERRAHPAPALTVLLPPPGALEHVARLARRRLDVLPRIELLAVQPDQLGLVVERVALARAAVHEELDDPPDLGSVVQSAADLWPRARGTGQRATLGKQLRKRRP